MDQSQILMVYLSEYVNNEDYTNYQLIPKYLLRASTAAPRYFLSSSTQTPPFLRISSSSGLHKSLLSLVSMKLSSWVKSPETWSSLQRSVLMGTFTILEYIFKISFSYLQLVGTFFLMLEASFAPFFSYFFSAASREVFLPLFLVSYFFSVFFSSFGSLKLIFNSLSSKQRYPSIPSCSTQATIFFIQGSPILHRQSLYRDLSPSTVRLILFFSTISSKVLVVILAQLESSRRSQRSS